MKTAPTHFTLRDGRSCLLRAARALDSGRILDHALVVQAADADLHVTEPDELQLTVEHLHGLLQSMRDSANSFYLLAEANAEVVGTVSVHGGRYRKVKHVGQVSLGVRPGWRRQGLARALMERAAEVARQSGMLRRLVLSVFARNEAARRLYESLGYEVEGRRRNALLIGDAYEDEFLMALEL